MAQLRNADKLIEKLRPQLSEVFNEFIVVGLRKLEGHEDKRVDEGSEREYYIAYGNPLVVGGLLKWALAKHILKIGKDGTVEVIDKETNKLVKLPLRDVLEKAMQDPEDT